MTKINDGGPAFPLKGPLTSDSLGMSLRDYFAAKALCGMEITAEGTMGGSFFYSPSALATRAYAIADAMLIERDKNAK
jgi:hypothetical protein